ncbi:MAG: DUF6516 family protein [Anaerolineae bacterium]
MIWISFDGLDDIADPDRTSDGASVRLRRYLERLYDTICSRQEIHVEHLRVEKVLSDRLGAVEERLCFYDGSLLEFDETVIVRGVVLIKTDYAYHYQQADGMLIFRYDNAPHHPEIPTHPDHIHIEGHVEAAESPDLSDVLRRIDGLLYPTSQQNGTPSEGT